MLSAILPLLPPEQARAIWLVEAYLATGNIIHGTDDLNLIGFKHFIENRAILSNLG